MPLISPPSSSSFLTHAIDRLVFELVQAAAPQSIEINALKKQAVQINYLAEFEFRYTIAHLFSEHLLTFDCDGNVALSNN